MKEGTTKRDFREQMNSFLEEHGYDALTPYHADMIFRQNIQTAYNVGHYQQMTDPDVMERRNYWQYQTAGDSHVREEPSKSKVDAESGWFPGGFKGSMGEETTGSPVRARIHFCKKVEKYPQAELLTRYNA